MGNPWFRLWVGTSKDEKIAEAAVIAEVPKSLVLSVWVVLLESACELDERGAYSTTPRRIGAVLGEPSGRIEEVFKALSEVGMICDGMIVAWEKRQPPSESNANAAERQRLHRERKKGSLPPAASDSEPETGDFSRHNLSRRVTPPEAEAEAESETDISSSSAGAGAGAGARDRGGGEAASVKPTPSGQSLEAQARGLMIAHPVAASPDFTPIADLVAQGRATREDVILGLTEAANSPNFRPWHWNKCVGWVLEAARRRTQSAQGAAGARGPPRGRPTPKTGLAVCLEIALGHDHDNPKTEAAGADAGPVIDGAVVAM
jgi:hypothetical protein